MNIVTATTTVRTVKGIASCGTAVALLWLSILAKSAVRWEQFGPETVFLSRNEFHAPFVLTEQSGVQVL